MHFRVARGTKWRVERLEVLVSVYLRVAAGAQGLVERSDGGPATRWARDNLTTPKSRRRRRCFFTLRAVEQRGDGRFETVGQVRSDVNVAV